MRFFLTGSNSFDLDFISPVDVGAGNFASKGQTLPQSYSIAKNVFRLVGKDKIDFVLICLTADILFRDADGNLTEDVFAENFQALNDYIKLCSHNGAKPVGVILPVAPSLSENYRKRFFEPLFNLLSNLKEIYDFTIVNLFNAELSEENFSDKTHLNETGASIIGVSLNSKLRTLKIFSEEDFYNMSYKFFNVLSYLEDKNSFQALMGKIYSYSVEQLRCKKKIKVAFVTDHASVWCGDKLYNLFAKNNRFETTVFLCRGSESTLEDTRHDLEQFKTNGINVVGIFDLREETPAQDIIFFLRPYNDNFSRSFQFDVMSPRTLLIYIPYSLATTPSFIPDYYGLPIFRLVWKHFFEAELSRKLYNERCPLGVPRGIISGAPKLDFFFEDKNKFSFKWKMIRPNAKKIIWAPHHSFNAENIIGIKSTFPYNYKFMYEFAKTHPETSWVVKPHPRLLFATLHSKIFSSVADYENYLRQWDELPNAQVFTGGYYQEIFITSDGMIHDSVSFIAEYQYTHKPMIYMLNDEREEFSKLGKKILSVSYLIDGKNHEQIATAIQKIIVEGNDPLKDARQKVFDEDLNHFKRNGMSASEFIFKNISQELKI